MFESVQLIFLLSAYFLQSQRLSFSRVKDTDLQNLSITETKYMLHIKPNWHDAVAKTALLGEDKLWSSKTLIRHLEMLENSVALSVCYTVTIKLRAALIPCQNEQSARAWVQAFFFRVFGMLPQNKRPVLNAEHHVPHTCVQPSQASDSFELSGLIDFTVAIGDGVSQGMSLFHVLTLLSADLSYRVARTI